MKRIAPLKLVLAAVLLISIPGAVDAYYFTSQLPAPAFDTVYTAFNKSAQFNQPKNWKLYEITDTTTQGSKIDYAVLHDQSESQSRVTRSVYIARSDVAGIFGLSPAIIAKLSEKDLVNVYMYKTFLGAVSPRFISAKLSTSAGMNSYTVEWSEMRQDNLRYNITETFMFKDKTVFDIRAEYAEFEPSYRAAVRNVTDSFKAL